MKARQNRDGVKRLNLTEYEEGGSVKRSYIAVANGRVWRQIDLWLTTGGRWIGLKAAPVSGRSEGRYLARAGLLTPDTTDGPDHDPAAWRKRHNL